MKLKQANLFSISSGHELMSIIVFVYPGPMPYALVSSVLEPSSVNSEDHHSGTTVCHTQSMLCID